MKRLALTVVIVIAAIIGVVIGIGHMNKKSDADPSVDTSAAAAPSPAASEQAGSVPLSQVLAEEQQKDQQQDLDSSQTAAQAATEYVKIYLNAPGAAYADPSGWLTAAHPLMTEDYYQQLVSSGENPFSDDTYSAMHERGLNITEPDLTCQPLVDDQVLNSTQVSVQCDYTTVTVGADGKPYDTTKIPTVWPYDTGLNETFVAQMSLVDGKWLVSEEVPLGQ